MTLTELPPKPPDPYAGLWELFDTDNNRENKWFGNFAAALQGARSVKWRDVRWIIYDPSGNVARRYDSGEEIEYWRAMKDRGSANIGPIPVIE